MSRVSRSLRRASGSVVRCSPAGHGGENSGRAVARTRRRAAGLCATRCPSSSSDDGSHQCRSSTRSTVGCTSLMARRPLRQSSSIVFRRCSSGLSCESRRRRQPDEFGDQRHRFRRRESAEAALDLRELLGRRVLGREAPAPARRSAITGWNGVPAVYGVAPRFEPRVRDGRQALAQLIDEPRLADSRFAEDDDVLPRPLPRPLPALEQASPARPRGRRTGVSRPAAIARRPRTPLGRTTR